MIDFIATAVLLASIAIFPHLVFTTMNATDEKIDWFVLAWGAIILFIVFVIDPTPPWRAAVNYTAPVEQVCLPCLC